MNSDSPVSSRLPAPISAPRNPLFCCEPSPKMVSISMPSSMYIIPPASATVASPGSSSTSTNCISLANNLIINLVHCGHGCLLQSFDPYMMPEILDT